MKSKSNSLISCYEEHYVNDLVIQNKTNLLPLNSYHNKGTRRQQHGKIYKNGYFIRNENKLSIKNNQIICDNPYLYCVDKLNSVGRYFEDLKLLRLYHANRILEPEDFSSKAIILNQIGKLKLYDGKNLENFL